MLKKMILLVVTLFTFSVSLDAMAFTLKKGTISLGGGSTFSIDTVDSDRSSSADSIGVSLISGYFIADNLEIGGGLDANYSNSDHSEFKGFSISPFVTYHFDLNAASNIFITGMVGYSKTYYDYDQGQFSYEDETDGTLFSAEIGWEYFFNPSVSTTIGVRYRWEEEDRYNSSYKSYGTNLGFKFYF